VTHIHIHAPAPVDVRCIVIDCPTCQRQRRAICKFFEWYGADVTCAGCGDAWSDGEMHERPFAPGWRRQGREYARRELGKIGVPA
jgi:hypothetical protein